MARAIGSVLTARTGIKTFADEAANTGFEYPCVEVAVTDDDEKTGIGGKFDFNEKGAGGNYTNRVKRMNVTSVVRLTAKAEATTTGSSSAECTKLLTTLKEEIDEIVYGKDVVKFIDPKTSEDQGVHGLKTSGISEPIIDVSHEPKIHTATMNLEVKHRREFKRTIERVMDPVKIVHGVV